MILPRKSMANSVFWFLVKECSSRLNVRIEQVRHGHHIRGKPPMVARTLKQRLQCDLNKTDPAISVKVNIGYSLSKPDRMAIKASIVDRKALRSNPDVQKQSRNRCLPIDLNTVRDGWARTLRPFHVLRIAQHYGVFQDLFGDAYFMPVLPMDVMYQVEHDTVVAARTGNVIKPVEASESPIIKYEAKPETLWTLIMCTPDGNMQNSNNEYCHWFLGNIPENRIEQAEQIIDYLKPIPPKGVGYYRYVFVLYKQNQHLDYTEYKKTEPCLQLRERDWNTLEFYRKHQDHLTPAGLAFFQSDWDPTVTQFYHTALDSKEPIFEYDFPEPYLKPQTWFPLKEPFNLYLDKYRDEKEIKKEFLLRKLKNVDPFKEPKAPLKYPNACAIDKDVPSWLKLERRKERMGWGRINDIK